MPSLYATNLDISSVNTVTTTRNNPSKYGNEDLISFAGRLTVWKCGPSQNPLLWWCDGGFNGWSEAADLHGLLAEFGC